MEMDAPSRICIALPERPSPQEALERLAHLDRVVLLDGSAGSGRALLSARPRRCVRWPAIAGVGRHPLHPLQELRDQLSPTASRGPGFRGGWIGYAGYEVADLLERLPPAGPPALALPTLWFGWYDWAVVWRAGEEAPHLEGAALSGASERELRVRMEGIRELLLRPPSSDVADGPSRRPSRAELAGEPLAGSALRSSLGRSGYLRGVERIREHIAAGDIFQANLTHQLVGSWSRGGLELFRRLRRASPAPHAAYIDTGEGEVASVSPETFLSLRDGRVRTRPIKGTAPRGRTVEEDRRLACALVESEKDRAENVMIVDLLRNDLSRVCQAGSVRVPALLELESHPTVHHLVSTVEGELAEGRDGVDLLEATMPGGSITGAPKIRAIEILREVEPVARGVYTGALGILERGGDLDLSVAIRTAVVRDGLAAYGTGGGITLASDPEAEWVESLDKAAAFLQAFTSEEDSPPVSAP